MDDHCGSTEKRALVLTLRVRMSSLSLGWLKKFVKGEYIGKPTRQREQYIKVKEALCILFSGVYPSLTRLG